MCPPCSSLTAVHPESRKPERICTECYKQFLEIKLAGKRKSPKHNPVNKQLQEEYDLLLKEKEELEAGYSARYIELANKLKTLETNDYSKYMAELEHENSQLKQQIEDCSSQGHSFAVDSDTSMVQKVNDKLTEAEAENLRLKSEIDRILKVTRNAKPEKSFCGSCRLF